MYCAADGYVTLKELRATGTCTFNGMQVKIGSFNPYDAGPSKPDGSPESQAYYASGASR